MSLYFTRFPVISYNGVFVRDITRRTNFIQQNFLSPFLFLPYTVKQGERPEDVAHFYYGSVDYTWLVLMANNIIDPYLDWILDAEQFHLSLQTKYKTLSGKTGSQIVDWTMTETIDENIVFYYDDEKDVKISASSISHVPNPSDYRPIRIYEYETEVNEAKGEIKLVDKARLAQVDKQFRSLIAQ
jgi:hypothetical protein